MGTPIPTLIRRAVKAVLATPDGEGGYPTPAMARVWPAHALPLQEKDTYPLVLIYDDQESADGEQDNLPVHALDLEFECYAMAGEAEALDDLLDLLAQRVFLAIEADETISQHAHRVDYKGTDKVRHRHGNQFSGLVTVRYLVKYTVPLLDASSLDDFLHFHGEYDLAPADGVTDATDDVKLPGPEE